MTSSPVPDPRPATQVAANGARLVAGRRCQSCGEATAFAWPRCPACAGELVPASFGPDGTVWSSTVVRIPVPGHSAPYALAYVDLDGGPRVLVHVVRDGRPRPDPAPLDGRVRLTEPSADGDLRVEVTQ